MKLLCKPPVCKPRAVAAAVLASVLAMPLTATADIATASARQSENGVLNTYDNVLSLQGGSNFRDLGGYQTVDNKTVRKGLLFRSGVMTGLTETDQQYLDKIGIDTVVDLRSREELELYPNHWAQKSGLNYVSHDYSMKVISGSMANASGAPTDMGALYKAMPYTLKPQLQMYFDQAINGEAPLVVNCSAGQDRTGIASALMLSALGVPRDVILEDYQLSTQYRCPQVERGTVDLKAAAETNDFAKMMLRYASTETSKASPLVTQDGTPYLTFALAQIDEDYGSVTAYLEQELDVTAADIARLKQQYLQ